MSTFIKYELINNGLVLAFDTQEASVCAVEQGRRIRFGPQPLEKESG